MELLMCSNSKCVQPPPQPKKPSDFLNTAALLPRVMWIEILSFTHRKWFEPEQTETEYLKQRLLEEQTNAAKAEQARVEAEARCHVAERERDVYRLLARRWQSRLHLILQQQRLAASTSSTHSSAGAVSSSHDVAVQENSSIGGSLADDSLGEDGTVALLGLGAMLRQITGEEESGIDQNLLLSDGHDSGEGSDNGIGDSEEEEAMDTDDAAIYEAQPRRLPQGTSSTKGAENNSVMMGSEEQVNEEEGRMSREIRAVSMSSDDL
mmetsp:Transcript_47451/g.143649  ORF Transcript_47451/g.143649 Transcript_47451/m.143649 type:complete len:265 (+) Transcript_47451:1284-2078(+)